MRYCSAWPAILAVFVCVVPVRAESLQQHLNFLEALREQEYFEYAQLYLDGLGRRTDLPAEMRQLIPFERAVTMIEQARTLTSPQDQTVLYDRARKLLAQFVKDAPNHPKSAEANSQRGRILQGQARVEIWESRSPANKDRKGSLQESARQLVTEARGIFQSAHDGYQKAWKAFPTYIDKNQDKQKYELRRQAEARYMMAQYNLARCTYDEAQTYDRHSEPYKKLLTEASKQFEQIHTRYRQQVVGLYARMWQGKCFEEQADINKAMGIYIELLGHPGRSATLQRLQNQVRLFRLICLNHEKKQDYTLVIQGADEWLRKRRTREQRSLISLGIRWQQVLAQEMLADQRKTEAKDRGQMLGRALTSCRFIQRWPSQYRDAALFKMRELQVRLTGTATTPADFDSAFGLAQNLVKQIKVRNDAVASAKREPKPADEIAKLEADRTDHLQQAVDMLKLALELADRQTSTSDINQARFYLAFVFFEMRANYEAAVLGDYVSRHVGQENQQMAIDSAYIAMASHIRAYSDSRTPEDKKVDMRLIEESCRYISSSWPGTPRAIDARMQLGSVYAQTGRPLKAAGEYAKIPESSENHADAQINAGQQYLQAYFDGAAAPADSRPPQDDLDKWQKAAATHLETGITRKSTATPPAEPPSDSLIAAKVSLAMIVIDRSEYQRALDLLEKDPHAVIKAITVPDESKRPGKGIKGREFASQAAQLVLRACIGLKQLEAAQTAMEQLERIAAGAGGATVTELYKQLGVELKKELERLQAAGDQQQLAEVRSSFVGFLERVRSRPQQSFASLIWIAETYSGLGEGSTDDAAQQQTMFERAAAAYEDIRIRSTADPTFVENKEWLRGVRLRLANCRRLQGKFADAHQLVFDLLNPQEGNEEQKKKARKKAGNAIDVQIEAARIYQAWGRDDQQYFELAITGNREKNILGWSQIALRLQRLIAANRSNAGRYGNMRYQARYQQAETRLLYARALQDDKKQTDQLQRAKQEIQSMVLVAANIDEKWLSKFDRLYQQIQARLGTAAAKVVSLAEYRRTIQPRPVPVPVAVISPARTVADSGPQPVAQTETGVSNLMGIGLAGMVLFGVAAVVIVMWRSGSRRRTRRYALPESAPVLPPAPARRRKSGSRKAAGQKPRQRTRSPKQRPKS